MQKSFCFIFGLTSICDKHCVLCCNNYDEIHKNVALDFNQFISKLRDMKIFCTSEIFKERFHSVYIILTGGEAFLYKQIDATEKKRDLFDVIHAIKTEMPSARIIIKTGGFLAHQQHHVRLWDRISQHFLYPMVEFRLGFNLYQKNGVRAIERLTEMLNRILRYQKMGVLDTIYDKNNLEKTIEVIESGLNQLGFNITQNTLRPIIQEKPEVHKRINIVNKTHKVVLDIGPAYSPNQASSRYDYFDELPHVCPTIDEYPNYLYYDADLKLVHCNDSYVDARVPSIRLPVNTVLEEWIFMKDRFFKLRDFLLTTKKQFATRKEQCFFCTKFVMDGRTRN